MTPLFDYFEPMEVSQREYGEGHKEQIKIACFVKRRNKQTSKEEIFLTLGRDGRLTVLAGERDFFEMLVQAARRVILEQTGLVCVEPIRMIFEKKIREVSDRERILNYFGFLVEVDYIQSEWKKSLNRSGKWVEVHLLDQISREIEGKDGELIRMLTEVGGFN